MTLFKNHPYGGFNFVVVVDGSPAAAFSEVTVPSATIELVEYRDGNDRTSQPRQVVGLTRYTNLVLRRGITQSLELFAWFDGVRQGTLDRRDVIVTLLSEDRQPLLVWHLRHCLPVKYAGPTLSANSSDVAIEEFQLAVEGIQIEAV